ncbi:MAG: ion transporter [Bacteroidia bacterium]|nr:ion transporter [Bacteroidia bacterium]NNC85653.1 ion transporter [Bacteroidia bacterium]NNM16718.1 ion transporter [Bacteroidia bacterium]
MNKESISEIVNDNTSKGGRVFDIFIQTLIVLSLIIYALLTEPNISEEWRNVLHISEWVIVVIFTIEYLLRIFLSPKPLKYIFSFLGIIDLLAILPFYLAIGDLSTIRVLRIFRIFRAFKLARYNNAISRLKLAFKIAKEEIMLFLLVSAVLLYLSAACIHHFEYEAQPEQFSSLFSSLWWSVGTLTTVGYGDVFPITVGGKIFTFFILIIGVGIVAVPAALLAEGLAQARKIMAVENGKHDDRAHHKDVT